MGFDGGYEARVTVASVRDLTRGLRIAADAVLVLAATGAILMLVQLRLIATAPRTDGDRTPISAVAVTGLHSAHTWATVIGWALFGAIVLTGALFLPWSGGCAPRPRGCARRTHSAKRG